MLRRLGSWASSSTSIGGRHGTSRCLVRRAYNHAELVKEFCGADPQGVPLTTCDLTNPDIAAQVAFKGKQLPYTPRFKGNLTARYTFEVGPWAAHLQGSVIYQSRNDVALRNADAQVLGSIPAYATADFSLGAERGNTSVELFIKNAFDQRGQSNRFTPVHHQHLRCGLPGRAPRAVHRADPSADGWPEAGRDLLDCGAHELLSPGSWLRTRRSVPWRSRSPARAR